MEKKIPTIEELEAILNSGEEFPYEILPNGELVPTDSLKEKVIELRAEVERFTKTNNNLSCQLVDYRTKVKMLMATLKAIVTLIDSKLADKQHIRQIVVETIERVKD